MWWLLLLAAAAAADELRRGCGVGRQGCLLKAEVVGLLDHLSREDTVEVLPGVRLVRDDGPPAPGGASSSSSLAAEMAREHPNDVDARLDAYLARRVAVFLDTHALSVKLPDPAAVMGWFATDAQTGRGKDKGGKGLQMLLAAAGMMKAMMGALGLGAVALLAGKALMTGLLALMLAAIVGLKSLAGGGGKHVTYEIVSKPVVSHVDTHSHEVVHEGHHGYGHSSYGRSFDVDPGAGVDPDGSQQKHRPVYHAAEAPSEPQRGYMPLGGGGVPRPHNTYLPLPLTAPGSEDPAAGT